MSTQFIDSQDAPAARLASVSRSRSSGSPARGRGDAGLRIDSLVPAEPGAPAPPRGLKELLEDYERDLILKALAEAGGHQRRAARALGVLPTTLNEKMRRLRLRADRGTPRG